MMKMMLKKMFNEDSSSPFGNMDSSSSDKFDMGNLAMPHAFSKSSISSTKTSKSMSTPWSNQSKRENGENSQTNGSRNITSRTAAHAPLLPTPFPTWSLKTAHTVKNGEESSCSSNANMSKNTRPA